MEAVSRYLEGQIEKQTLRSILENVAGKRDFKIEAVEALVQAGDVDRTVGPRGAKLHMSERPYREGDR